MFWLVVGFLVVVLFLIALCTLECALNDGQIHSLPGRVDFPLTRSGRALFFIIDGGVRCR